MRKSRADRLRQLREQNESLGAMLGWCVARLGSQVVMYGDDVRELIANTTMKIERMPDGEAVRVTMEEKLIVVAH